MYDAFFFDCDGVITNKRAQVDSQVIFEAYRHAHSGRKIAFVTGRSLDWFSKNLIPAIERFNPTPEEKRRFFFIGEYGNRWLSFSGGTLAHGSDDSLAVPEKVRTAVRNEMHRFPYLSFDETKESFISIEVRHERLVSPQAEREAQRQIDEARGAFAAKFPQLVAIRTLYAVDVMGKGVGKAAATRRALELMGSVSQALVIGDSEIDLEMGEELRRKGIEFDFYYVGEGQIPRPSFPVKKAPGLYAEGTLEVLRGVR